MILQKVRLERWIWPKIMLIISFSPKDTARPQIKDLVTIKEEFRVGEGCQISGLSNSLIDSESHGIGGGAKHPY